MAVAGPVAFVGLMVPHACRLVVGADYRRLIPLSFLAGAGLTELADVGSRTALGSGGEIPLGVVTAMLGALVFSGWFAVAGHNGSMGGRRWVRQLGRTHPLEPCC